MMIIYLLALATVAPGTSLPLVSIKPTGDGYSATAPSLAGSQLAAVENEVSRRAQSICEGKDIAWGRFNFTGALGKQTDKEASTVTGYMRNFRCVDAQAIVGERAPDDWKPSPADEAEVRQFFSSYFGLRDSGAADAAMGMFQQGVVSDPKQWAADLTQANFTRGPGTRRITGVTWYVNPSQAGQAGVFAAIDFAGEYPSMHFYCGYLGLLRRGPGSYVIVREEQNSFNRSTEGPAPPQLAEARAAMCRNN